MWLPSPRCTSILNYTHRDSGLVVPPRTYNTHEAAKKLGVHRSTLLRWFAQKRIGEVRRDRNNWRVFTAQDLERIEKEVRRNEGGGER